MEQLSFSNEETSFFNYLFSLYSKSIPNYITGTEVYSLFLKSNLNKSILKRIWDLSSIRKQVNLSKFEFFFACRLISFAQKGENLIEDTIKSYDKHMILPVFEGILYENKNKNEKKGNLDELFNYLSHNIEVITKNKIINEDGFNNIEIKNSQANQISQTSKNNTSTIYNNEYNTNNINGQYVTSNNNLQPNQINQNQPLSYNNIPLPSNRKESVKEEDFEFEEVKEEGDVNFNEKEKEIVEKQIEKINNLDLFLSKMILDVKDNDEEKKKEKGKQRIDMKSEVNIVEYSRNINISKDFEKDKEKSKKDFEVEDDFEFEEVVENKDDEGGKEKEEKLNDKEIKIRKEEEGKNKENVNIVVGNIDDFFGKMEEMFITKNDNNDNNERNNENNNNDNNERNDENKNNDNNERNDENYKKNDENHENEIKKMENDNETDFEFEEVEEKSNIIINDNEEIQIEAEKEKVMITLNTNQSNNHQANEIKNENETEKSQAEDEFDFEEVDEKNEKIEKDYTFDGLLKGFTMENPSLLKEKQNERKVEINETDNKQTPPLMLIELLMLRSKVDDKKLIKNTYLVLDELTKVLNSSIDYITSKLLPFYKKYSNENEEIVNSLEAITENRKINDFGKRVSYLFELYSNNVSLLNMYKNYMNNDKSYANKSLHENEDFDKKHDLYLNDYKSKLSKLTEINSIIDTNLTSFCSIKLDSIEIINNKNNQYDDTDKNGSFCGLCLQKILQNKAFLYGFDYHYICINFWINKIRVGSQNED